MKKQIVVGSTVFVIGLWIAVVATYAAQIKRGDSSKATPFEAPTSCSSSSSSNGA